MSVLTQLYVALADLEETRARHKTAVRIAVCGRPLECKHVI